MLRPLKFLLLMYRSHHYPIPGVGEGALGSEIIKNFRALYNKSNKKYATQFQDEKKQNDGLFGTGYE